jgi:phytoene dehydrogenase-like protein
MSYLKENDCIVIGSGPNGLAAAIALQSCGFKTHIIEKHQIAGGGLKSEQAPEPGFIFDTCSAIHPMVTLSPFFRALNFKDSNLEWIYPEIPCAHPLKDGACVALYSSLLETVDQFNAQGARRYRHLFETIVKDALLIADEVLQPPLHLPTHPLKLAAFGARAIWPAFLIARYLADEKAAALFAGMAAHSFLPFNKFLSGAAGIMLMLAGHRKGWPLARGGSGQISRFLIEKFQGLGLKLGQRF